MIPTVKSRQIMTDKQMPTGCRYCSETGGQAGKTRLLPGPDRCLTEVTQTHQVCNHRQRALRGTCCPCLLIPNEDEVQAVPVCYHIRGKETELCGQASGCAELQHDPWSGCLGSTPWSTPSLRVDQLARAHLSSNSGQRRINLSCVLFNIYMHFFIL